MMHSGAIDSRRASLDSDDSVQKTDGPLLFELSLFDPVGDPFVLRHQLADLGIVLVFGERGDMEVDVTMDPGKVKVIRERLERTVSGIVPVY